MTVCMFVCENVLKGPRVSWYFRLVCLQLFSKLVCILMETAIRVKGGIFARPWTS